MSAKKVQPYSHLYDATFSQISNLNQKITELYEQKKSNGQASQRQPSPGAQLATSPTSADLKRESAKSYIYRISAVRSKAKEQNQTNSQEMYNQKKLELLSMEEDFKKRSGSGNSASKGTPLPEQRPSLTEQLRAELKQGLFLSPEQAKNKNRDHDTSDDSPEKYASSKELPSKDKITGFVDASFISDAKFIVDMIPDQLISSQGSKIEQLSDSDTKTSNKNSTQSVVSKQAPSAPVSPDKKTQFQGPVPRLMSPRAHKQPESPQHVHSGPSEKVASDMWKIVDSVLDNFKTVKQKNFDYVDDDSIAIIHKLEDLASKKKELDKRYEMLKIVETGLAVERANYMEKVHRVEQLWNENGDQMRAEIDDENVVKHLSDIFI